MLSRTGVVIVVVLACGCSGKKDQPEKDDSRVSTSRLTSGSSEPGNPAQTNANNLKQLHAGKKLTVAGKVKSSNLDPEKIVVVFDVQAARSVSATFLPQNTRGGVFRGFDIGEDYEIDPPPARVPIDQVRRVAQEQAFKWEAKTSRWKGRLPWKDGRTLTVTGTVKASGDGWVIEDARFDACTDE